MSLPVRLMHYAPRWRQEFEQSKSVILQSCDGCVVNVATVLFAKICNSILTTLFPFGDIGFSHTASPARRAATTIAVGDESARNPRIVRNASVPRSGTTWGVRLEQIFLIEFDLRFRE